MKTTSTLSIVFTLLATALTSSCDLFDIEDLMKFQNTKITTTFTEPENSPLNHNEHLTKQTPSEYKIALFSANIFGKEGNPDHTLFLIPDLNNAYVFNFTEQSQSAGLFGGSSVPSGKYRSIELGIFYLQMRIQIATSNRGVEWRNIRIYLTEYEGIKRGDVLQVDNNGNIIGWLFGENQIPDFDPVSPRHVAYTHGGDGLNWYSFHNKHGHTFGPFGDMQFWNSAPKPYKHDIAIDFAKSDNKSLIIDFNVHNCWQFEDRNGDGYFGSHELNPNNPAQWHMELPRITLRLE